VLAKSPALRSEKRPHDTYSPQMAQRNREAQGQTQHAPIINLKEFVEQVEWRPIGHRGGTTTARQAQDVQAL
jgi:hypothetical protein